MLEQVDLKARLTREEYVKQVTPLQNQLHLLGFQVYEQKRPMVLVFEGWDAAGKGGAIKRLTEKLDPRGYVVYPIAAPSGDDKVRHYLYRFWRRLPEQGQIAIFDRSWYGRVLVERVEGYCSEAAWTRAYSEINQFERELVEFGTIIFKFWMHLSQTEQLRRFKERERTDYKQWKLTDEDWRNRGKWEDYEQAVEDMLLKTSTLIAPWTIVEANDKLHARIKVLKTAVNKLKQELGQKISDYGPLIEALTPHQHVIAMLARPSWPEASPNGLRSWEPLADDLLDFSESRRRGRGASRADGKSAEAGEVIGKIRETIR